MLGAVVSLRQASVSSDALRGKSANSGVQPGVVQSLDPGGQQEDDWKN